MKSKLLRNISMLALLNSFALIVQGFSQGAPLTNARIFPPATPCTISAPLEARDRAARAST